MHDSKHDYISTFISSIRDGNENAFEFFFRAEYPGLKHFVYQYIHDYELVEDVIQDAFLSLWKNRAFINPSKNIRSYLYTIVRNRTVSLLRENGRFVSGSVEDMENHFFIKVLSGEEMSSRIDSLEMETVIKKIYETLPQNVHEIFRLSREEGLTYEEIASRRGISVRTVERSISQALKLFRKKLSRFTSLLFFFMWG
jgi:RNA polymerase sigma-70 factor (ECF subfamily)